MLVTVLPSIVAGMISAPDAFLSQPVMVTALPSVSYLKGALTDTASVGIVSATDSFSPQPATSSAANSSRAFFIAKSYLPLAQGASGVGVRV